MSAFSLLLFILEMELIRTKTSPNDAQWRIMYAGGLPTVQKGREELYRVWDERKSEGCVREACARIQTDELNTRLADREIKHLGRIDCAI